MLLYAIYMLEHTYTPKHIQNVFFSTHRNKNHGTSVNILFHWYSSACPQGWGGGWARGEGAKITKGKRGLEIYVSSNFLGARDWLMPELPSPGLCPGKLHESAV